MAILGDKIDDVPGHPGGGRGDRGRAWSATSGRVEEMLRRHRARSRKAVSRGGEKLREKIAGAADRIRLNRQLVALRCDLELAYAPESFERQPPDDAARPGALRRAGVLAAAQGPARAAAHRARGGGRGARRRRGALEAAVRFLAGRRARWASGRSAPAAARRPAPTAGGAGPGRRRARLLPAARPPLPGRAPASSPARRCAARRSGPLVEGEVEKHAHGLKAAMHAPGRAGAGLARAGHGHRARQPPAPAHPARARPGRRGRASGSPTSCPATPAAATPPGGPGGCRWRACRWRRRPPGAGPARPRCPTWPGALRRRWRRRRSSRSTSEVERPLVPVLVEMERAGIAVDSRAPWPG